MADELDIDIKGFHEPGRYAVTRGGYVYDRRLFKLLSVVVVIIMLTAFWQLGGVKQYAYASCPLDAVGGLCDNPLYSKCDLPACQKETLWPGETIGEKPPGISTPLLFVFLATALTFLINHLAQNNTAYEVARNEKRNSNKRVHKKRPRRANKALKRQTKRRPKE